MPVLVSGDKGNTQKTPDYDTAMDLGVENIDNIDKNKRRTI